MSLKTFLLLAGSSFEILGLVTVAVGISKTRRTFLPDQPSVPRKAWTGMKRVVARFRKPHPQTVHGVGASMFGIATVTGRGRVSMGSWDGVTVEERTNQLRRFIENHDTELERLDDKIIAEEKSRTEADQQHEGRLTAVQRQLDDSIREAAAGGLRLETIGVVLFIAGVVLGTWANLIA